MIWFYVYNSLSLYNGFLETYHINNQKIHHFINLCLLLFNFPPVCELCPNHEVTKPWTGTSMYLGSVTYCCIDVLYDPPCPIYFPPDVFLGVQTNPAPPLTPYLAAHSVPAQDHLSTQASPVSVPACRKFPTSISACHTESSAHLIILCLHPSLTSTLAPQRINLLLPTPALTTTDIFLLLRPSCRQNIFYSSPQLFPWCRFPPPSLTAPPPSAVPCLIFTHLIYWLQHYPLLHCGLPTVDILPQSLCPSFPENTRRPLLLPCPIPLLPRCLPRNLPEESHMDSPQTLVHRRQEQPCFWSKEQNCLDHRSVKDSQHNGFLPLPPQYIPKADPYLSLLSGIAEYRRSVIIWLFQRPPQVSEHPHTLISLRPVFSRESEGRPYASAWCCNVPPLPLHLIILIAPFRPLMFDHLSHRKMHAVLDTAGQQLPTLLDYLHLGIKTPVHKVFPKLACAVRYGSTPRHRIVHLIRRPGGGHHVCGWSYPPSLTARVCVAINQCCLWMCTFNNDAATITLQYVQLTQVCFHSHNSSSSPVALRLYSFSIKLPHIKPGVHTINFVFSRLVSNAIHWNINTVTVKASWIHMWCQYIVKRSYCEYKLSKHYQSNWWISGCKYYSYSHKVCYFMRQGYK